MIAASRARPACGGQDERDPEADRGEEPQLVEDAP